MQCLLYFIKGCSMFSLDRLKHSMEVARLMKSKCEQMGKSQDYARQMFHLGLIHDIGYEFGDNSNHNIIGGGILDKSNYKYYKEVENHGNPNTEYKSFELDLLNWADMHISSIGNYVEFEERLKDIETRYGKVSETYTNAYKVVEKLKG